MPMHPLKLQLLAIALLIAGLHSSLARTEEATVRRPLPLIRLRPRSPVP